MIAEARRISHIDVQKAELRAALKALDEERAALEQTVLDEMSQENVKRLVVDNRTVYLWHQKRVRALDPAAAVQWLIDNAMPDCVMVGTQRLGALVREDQGLEEQLPAEMFEVADAFAVRTRKAD